MRSLAASAAPRAPGCHRGELDRRDVTRHDKIGEEAYGTTAARIEVARSEALIPVDTPRRASMDAP
jgi:hypothetical protein